MPGRSIRITILGRCVDHLDLAQLIAEQQPDTTAPCPHCGQPVGDSRNIRPMGIVPRLIVTCGGSGLAYTGHGCFNEVAWDSTARRWLAWNRETRKWEA